MAPLFRQIYAFIGLERVGGIMMRDVTNPKAPNFVQYLSHRDFGAARGTGRVRGHTGCWTWRRLRSVLRFRAQSGQIAMPIR